uniref:TetR/AcrR family transcriptional regulator n=1 Tax=uncultured Erythrobacter sp. TaxID=263913 RepID=UPI002606C7F5|nr:TetR/AcrR family transcriptional regulator [uncultured Erythrobacter sp.]
MKREGPEATRERLLHVATEEFAARGFYGASIAQIAGRLNLSKQALLYHFKRKEDLYAEVFKRISHRLLSAVQMGAKGAKTPEAQFEGIILGFYSAARENPLDTKVLMRELLDNQRSDAPAEEWHLKNFLDAIVAKLDEIDGKAAQPLAQKLAAIYTLVSSIEYFAASVAVIQRFYGDDEFERVEAAYLEELRGQIRRIIV